MPERPRWRFGRAKTEEQRPAEDAPAGEPAADGPSHLHRAAECYLRAGQSVEAARCLARAGDHGRAARLYLRAGDYPAAAQAYADVSDAEASAWIRVHDLGDARTARSILTASPERSTGPAAGELTAEHDLAAEWRPRLRRLGDKVAGIPRPAAGPQESPAVRDGLGNLISTLQSGSLSAADATLALSGLRARKLAAVEAQDWAAGYALTELERLLTDLKTAHEQEHEDRLGRAQAEDGRALARRQVYARCDVADGITGPQVLRVLAETQQMLQNRQSAGGWPERAETWGVAIAEAMHRYDQAALIFAASVRGRQPGSAARWHAWSARVLKTEVAIPAEAGVA
jgi:hypothetical protein